MSTGKKNYDGEEAASELIGVILLISLAIIGISVISVMFFSQTTSVAIPKLETLVGYDEDYAYIYHNGGDSLTAGTYSIMVDFGLGSGYEDKTSDFSIDGEGDTVWSTGESLVYKYSAGNQPKLINLIYIGEGEGTLITSTPLVYSQSGGVSAGTGDEGITVTFPDDPGEYSNPVEIISPSSSEELYYGYSLDWRWRWGPWIYSEEEYDNLIIVKIDNSEGFVADVVQYIVYNYDTIDPNDFNANLLEGSMTVNLSLGLGFDHFSADLNNLGDICTIPSGSFTDYGNPPYFDDFNAVLNIVAYNTTTGQIFSNSGKYVVVGVSV